MGYDGLANAFPGIKGAEVVGISPENSRVETTGRNLDYDYLIISLGAELHPKALPGFYPAEF